MHLFLYLSPAKTSSKMGYQVVGIAIAVVIYLFVKYLNHTDTPKIKNLPEVPGLPLFGSLLKFGSDHATAAYNYSKTYGPVFQVRLGNRVRPAFPVEFSIPGVSV